MVTYYEIFEKGDIKKMTCWKFRAKDVKYASSAIYKILKIFAIKLKVTYQKVNTINYDLKIIKNGKIGLNVSLHVSEINKIRMRVEIVS